MAYLDDTQSMSTSKKLEQKDKCDKASPVSFWQADAEAASPGPDVVPNCSKPYWGKSKGTDYPKSGPSAQPQPTEGDNA